MPLVAVVVLSWNRAEATLACLQSLAQQHFPGAQVIVVDNGSTDGTPDQVREKYPWVEVIETGRNLGYGGGNNVGIQAALAAGADYVWLLNNDTLVEPDALTKLVQAAEARPGAGAWSPRILTRETPARIWYAGGSLGTVLTRSTHHAMWRNAKDETSLAQRSVSYVPGCALLLRRTAIEETGPWEERFFLYWEDVDYCRRLSEHGWGMVYVPDALVLHTGAGSSDEPGGTSATFDYYHTRNALWYLKANARGLRLLPSLAYRAGSLALRTAQLLLSRERDKGRKLSALVRGLKDGVIGHP
jgi:GT2 family glycosyltransferase